MKKDRRAQHELNYLKKLLPKLKHQAAQTKSGKLWHLESVVRKKLKDLRTLSGLGLGDYRGLYDGYVELLGEVSERLLEHYNKTNKTEYKFEEIVPGNFKSYLNSGIISVLVTNHIPKIVAEQFSRLLPENPKDFYPEARKIKRRFFLHLGDTNTGKTYNALQRLKQSGNGLYLAPLRILALENFERLNSEGVRCNLLTGEEEIRVDGASHSSCTVEKADIDRLYEVAIIDEVQLLADLQRGDAWTRAILGLRCPEIHLCGALSAKEQLIRMIGDCGDELEIREYSRLVPLKVERRNVRPDDVQKGDALVAFSKRRVLELSRYFGERGITNSVIYGDLPPEVRRMQYSAFVSGENQILISTDAIGMGVNLPIRRIVFTDIKKFDGEEVRFLSSQEVKQIAGRAGRIGIYEVGYVACMDEDISFIEDMLRTQDDEIEKAVVGPGEAILDIGILPLKEKLALWSTREEALNYYRKKDVRDYILILDSLKPYKLPEALEWKLMSLPFDVNSEELLEQFITYVEEIFVLKRDRLSRPTLNSFGLSEYEEYYQKVNLYYSFSKALNLDFDEEWVYEERKQISSDINNLL
ncbi:MAG TPA: RNA helicase [Clostridiales bacterium]|jgi:ATP-dependent RNA helicase SUPV3L1/SUV3|nr:RNA helicase [Clostridiales bacterium]